MNNQSSLILVQVCLSTSVSADILILPSSILKDDYHFRNAVSEKKTCANLQLQSQEYGQHHKGLCRPCVSLKAQHKT